MNGKTQTSKEVGDEDDALTGAGLGNPDGSGTCRPFDQGGAIPGNLGLRQIPRSLKRSDVLLADD